MLSDAETEILSVFFGADHDWQARIHLRIEWNMVLINAYFISSELATVDA